MKARIRRLGAAVGVLGIAGALAAAPASAATSTPEVFVGNAVGQALHINVLGQEATYGVSSAKINSSLNAVAEGAGDLLVLATQNKSEVTGAGRNAAPQTCAAPTPLNVADVVGLGIACSSTTAEVLGGMPHAFAEGSVAGLDVSANNLVALLPVELPIGDVLSTVLGPLTNTPLNPVSTTVTDLVNSVLKTKTLEVRLGESTSEVTTTASKISSVGTAKAAEIRLLPTPDLAGVTSLEPLATITISSAKAVAEYDRATGKAVPTVDPALVTVRLNTVLSNSLGLQEIKIAPGVSQTILAGTPLESDIIVAAGKTLTNADGSVQAIADGVKLHLLKGISGGINLELAHAEAAVGGSPAVNVAAPVPVVPPGLELPRTGGGALIPLAGMAVLVLGFGLRRTLVRAD